MRAARLAVVDTVRSSIRPARCRRRCLAPKPNGLPKGRQHRVTRRGTGLWLKRCQEPSTNPSCTPSPRRRRPRRTTRTSASALPDDDGHPRRLLRAGLRHVGLAAVGGRHRAPSSSPTSPSSSRMPWRRASRAASRRSRRATTHRASSSERTALPSAPGGEPTSTSAAPRDAAPPPPTPSSGTTRSCTRPNAARSGSPATSTRSHWPTSWRCAASSSRSSPSRHSPTPTAER